MEAALAVRPYDSKKLEEQEGLNDVLFPIIGIGIGEGEAFFCYRPYNPETGRFLSEDPIEFGAGDRNLYRYVFNNPINDTDPTGTIGKYVKPILIGVLIGTGLIIRKCNIKENEEKKKDKEIEQAQNDYKRQCEEEIQRLNEICKKPHLRNSGACLAPRRSCGS